jgi:hypothetical protein
MAAHSSRFRPPEGNPDALLRLRANAPLPTGLGEGVVDWSRPETGNRVRRCAFLLATPPILAAGGSGSPSLTGSAGAHIHGQVLLGVVVTAITAYLSVRCLVRYFRTRTLIPSPSTAWPLVA